MLLFPQELLLFYSELLDSSLWNIIDDWDELQYWELQHAFPYFSNLINQISKIPEITNKKLLISTQRSYKSQISRLLDPDLNIFQEILKELEFSIKGKGKSRGKEVFFVNSPIGNSYLISPNASIDEKVIKWSWEEFKGYRLSTNKVYKITKKTDRKISDIVWLAKDFYENHPQASLGDFFLTFMPKNTLQDLTNKEDFDKIPLKYGLLELDSIIPQLNSLGNRNEKQILFIQNHLWEFLPLGQRKEVSTPQKAKNWFHNKEAITFEVKDFDETKGILVTNGEDSDFIPL